jgi:ankyrin repeat protein
MIKSTLINRISNQVEELQFYIIKDSSCLKFKEIFERGEVEIESKDEKGNTFLSLATQANCIEIIEFLIEKNADVNTQNKLLNTPLHYALSNQNFYIANILLKKRASENLCNKDGLIPWQCIDNPIRV